MITMNAYLRLPDSLSRLSSSVLNLTFPSIVMEGGDKWKHLQAFKPSLIVCTLCGF